MKTMIRTVLSGFLLLSIGGTAGAQAPIAGQPYQVPSGYQNYGAGTSISYGGYNYVIQSDGNMLLAADSQPSVDSGTAGAQAPIAGQPYQVPSGYQNYGAGTSISYGGYNYVIQSDGNMLLAADSQPSVDSGTAGAQAPIAGQPYQVPSGYQNYGAGTLISYGGYNYVIQSDGNMLLAADSQPSQTYQPQYTQPSQTYQPQYTQPSQTYQPQYTQPSQTYQPQYTQPSQTYQSQYTYRPATNPYTYGGMTPGSGGVTGVGGGRTLGNSNVAIGWDPATRQWRTQVINPNMSGQNLRRSGNYRMQRGNR